MIIPTTRRAIPTRYNGVLFRSKLEADWARTFDALEIPWEYEREGQYFGDVFYLPDFYLPESRQHVEVKGVWKPRDFEKALALVTENEDREVDPGWGYPLISCMPGGVFFGLRRMAQLGEVRLGRCGTCEAWYFFDEDAGWVCRRCKARNLCEVLSSPLITWKGAA